MSKSEKKRIFRSFAQGKTPKEVADPPGNSGNGENNAVISASRTERLFEGYLSLPLGEKLRLTLMPECIANRLHRIMDDISDLNRIDALLDATDEKAVVLLIDLKRKIKERMAKEYAPRRDDQSGFIDAEIENEIERYHRKIFPDSSS